MAEGAAEQERATERASWALAIASGALIAQHVAGRSTRDALYLSHFDVSTLPAAMIGAAAVSFVAVLGASRLLARLTPARVVPGSFAIAALLFGGEWALARVDERAAAVAVYAHTAVFGAAAGSAFWSLVNERFDPHTAKRVVSRIAGGGTVGGIVGGLIAWRAAAYVSVATMLALLAGINLVGVAATATARRGEGARMSAPADIKESGVKVIADMPYLRHLAILVFVGATAQALLDYMFSDQAARSFGKGPQLLGFFALYHLGVSVVTFAAQAGLVRPSLERRGLAGTLALHPATVAGAALLTLVLPGLGSIVVMRGAEAAARNSLYRSAFELLYTPLPPAKKRASKTIIDVGVDRVGTAIGSGAILLLLSVATASAMHWILVGLVLALTFVSYVVCGWLHRGYVEALAFSLKSGAVDLEATSAHDLDTRRTLAETTALLDREKLLEKIGELQRVKRERAALAQSGPRAAPDTVVRADASPHDRAHTAPTDDPVLHQIAQLRSGDPQAVRAALARPLDPRVAIHAVHLLDDDAHVRAAVTALRKAAPRISGMLIDVLLDSGLGATEKVRRRLPRVLKASRSRRTVDGLLAALEDESFDVRMQVALALGQIVAESGARVDRDAVFDVAVREISERRADWALSRGATLDDDRALVRGVTHVFSLLQIVVDRAPVSVALRALRSDDVALRGTAHELLEVVLPPRVRDALLPLVERLPRTAPAKPDDATRLAAELSRSHDGRAAELALPSSGERDA
jgi:ATP:ADP antiporter, AAA family